MFVLLTVVSCNRSKDTPTEPTQASWRISGKSYVAGSTATLPGVVIRCAGLSSASGADGSYEIRGVPGGTQMLTAEKTGCESYSRSIEVNSDLTLFVYLGIQSSNLRGYVTNAVEGPIQGAKVSFGGFVDFTNVSGGYKFLRIPLGTDTIIVTHPAYNGYKSVVSLNTSDRQHDVVLRKDSVIDGRITAAYYVDQSQPSRLLPSYPNLDRLYLSSSGYDSLGQYHGGVERNIYINFEFPVLLKDNRVSVVEGDLQLCTDAPYTSFTVQTYSLRSLWSYELTYNAQPAIGSLLFSASLGGSSPAKYWSVLDTNGWSQLLAEYRTLGLTYGVVIKGGGIDPKGFHSTRSSENRPKITFKVRY